MGNVTWDIAHVKDKAEVSCSPSTYVLGANGIGIWLTDKLGCAWVIAWVGAWVVHGCMVVGWFINHPTTSPHPYTTHAPTHARLSLPVTLGGLALVL